MKFYKLALAAAISIGSVAKTSASNPGSSMSGPHYQRPHEGVDRRSYGDPRSIPSQSSSYPRYGENLYVPQDRYHDPSVQQPQQGNEMRNPIPPPLPEGWTEYMDPKSGRPYYYNALDGSTTWERPVAPPENVQGNVRKDYSDEERLVDDGNVSNVQDELLQSGEIPRKNVDERMKYPQQDESEWGNLAEKDSEWDRSNQATEEPAELQSIADQWQGSKDEEYVSKDGKQSPVALSHEEHVFPDKTPTLSQTEESEPSTFREQLQEHVEMDIDGGHLKPKEIENHHHQRKDMERANESVRAQPNDYQYTQQQQWEQTSPSMKGNVEQSQNWNQHQQQQQQDYQSQPREFHESFPKEDKIRQPMEHGHVGERHAHSDNAEPHRHYAEYHEAETQQSKHEESPKMMHSEKPTADQQRWNKHESYLSYENVEKRPERQWEKVASSVEKVDGVQYPKHQSTAPWGVKQGPNDDSGKHFPDLEQQRRREPPQQDWEPEQASYRDERFVAQPKYFSPPPPSQPHQQQQQQRQQQWPHLHDQQQQQQQQQPRQPQINRQAPPLSQWGTDVGHQPKYVDRNVPKTEEMPQPKSPGVTNIVPQQNLPPLQAEVHEHLKPSNEAKTNEEETKPGGFLFGSLFGKKNSAEEKKVSSEDMQQPPRPQSDSSMELRSTYPGSQGSRPTEFPVERQAGRSTFHENYPPQNYQQQWPSSQSIPTPGAPRSYYGQYSQSNTRQQPFVPPTQPGQQPASGQLQPYTPQQGETGASLKNMLGNAWQGVIGFSEKAKTAANQYKDLAIQEASRVTETVSAQGAGILGRVKNQAESIQKTLFESEKKPPPPHGYSMSPYGSVQSTGSIQHQQPPANYPPQNYGGYPRDFVPPVPRGTQPYPHQQGSPGYPNQYPPRTWQEYPESRPPLQSQYGHFPPGYPPRHQRPDQRPPMQGQMARQYPDPPQGYRGIDPHREQLQQEQQLRQMSKQQRSTGENTQRDGATDPWSHPGLDEF